MEISRISCFPHKVLAINCPSDFLEESEEYAKWYDKETGKELGKWISLKRLSCKLFANYFNQKQQYEEKHGKWSAERNHNDLVLQTEGIKSYISFKPKACGYNGVIAEPLKYNFTRNEKYDKPEEYFCTFFWSPIMLYIGWIASDELEFGKSTLTVKELHSLAIHPIIADFKEIKYV